MEISEMRILSVDALRQLTGARSTGKEDLYLLSKYTINPKYIERPFMTETVGIILCTSGRVELLVDMRTRVLTAGTVMVHGTSTILEFKASENPELHVLMMRQSFAEDTMLDLKAAAPIIKYLLDNTRSQLQLKEEEVNLLLKFFDLINDIIQLEKSDILRDISSGLIRTLGEMYNRRLLTDVRPMMRQNQYFEKFLRTVAEHHKSERSICFYADALHITPKYLSTVIKEVSGRSAAKWINDFVIQQAKLMLKYTNKSVQEITYELNFATQSFFGKYFKRYTGLSPVQYRRND